MVQQIERGVVFRLGRAQPEPRRPGFTMLIPVVDRMKRVNMQVVTLPVPAQDGITKENVTVRVDAVVCHRMIDSIGAVVQVQDCAFANRNGYAERGERPRATPGRRFLRARPGRARPAVNPPSRAASGAEPR